MPKRETKDHMEGVIPEDDLNVEERAESDAAQIRVQDSSDLNQFMLNAREAWQMYHRNR